MRVFSVRDTDAKAQFCHAALKRIAELSVRADRKGAFEADLRFFRG